MEQVVTVMRKAHVFIIAHVLLLCVLTLGCAHFEQEKFYAEEAAKWTMLFDRNTGWTGADSCYSFQLNGQDMHSVDDKTVFLFSDTAIGNVDIKDCRSKDTVIIDNSMAILHGDPETENIAFFWNQNDKGKPVPLFKPDTPNSHPEDFYWMQDGFVLNRFIYIFMLRMKRTGPGSFDFETRGVSMLRLPQKPPPYLEDEIIQQELPLFVPSNTTHGDITFGSAILFFSEKAGYSKKSGYSPDGYIYIYGVRHDVGKKLLAARVRPESFETISSWRFWNGAAWVPGITSATPITDRISSEFSVTPLSHKEFLLVFQKDALGDSVAVRVGKSPVSFGPPIDVYQCPEKSLGVGVFTYNAKAHPSVSRPGELIVSYNVNTVSYPDDFMQYASMYRPRFIRLWWE